MLLVKLWIAKKLAVLLAVRAFGVKRLYRKGLRLSRFAYGDARTNVRTNGEWMMRKTCQTAMKTEQWFVRKATAFTERAFESAGFTRRGMPSAGAGARVLRDDAARTKGAASRGGEYDASDATKKRRADS